MAQKIVAMTDEQWEALEQFREEWYRIGSICGPTDRAQTSAVIAQMYYACGKPPPIFLWVQSPATAWLGIAQLSLSPTSGALLMASLEASMKSTMLESLLD